MEEWYGEENVFEDTLRGGGRHVMVVWCPRGEG